MPYIGNTIRAADDYRLIDDISSGFNGSETSFALQVAGSAPVPFPKSPQQVLISVNGVIQEPDPTGSSGFNLVGTNIVFSSAPSNGHAFFGIIYATADYLNAGGNFPAGSLGAPSITFIGDENSGLYRKGSGSVGFVSDATEIANFDSNGITISSGNIIIPDSIIHNGDTNTKIRFPAADTISAETAGTEALRITSTGRLGINETSPSQKLHVGGDIQVGFTTPNDAARQLNFNVNRGSAGDTLANINWQWNDKFVAQIRGIAGDDTTNKDDAALGFFTSAANSLVERLRIQRNGNIGAGTSDPKTKFHILQSAVAAAPARSSALYLENDANCEIQFVGNSSNDCQLRFGTSNNSFLGAIEYELDNANMEFYTGGSERLRILGNGRVGIGTTSPDAKLQVAGSAHVTGQDSVGLSAIQFSFSAPEGHIKVKNTSGGPAANLAFHTTDTSGNTNRVMHLKHDGTVGIGTTSPKGLLHSHISDGARNDFSTSADGLIIEKGGSTGISIDPGSSGSANIFFPNESNHSIASISHNNSTGEFRLRGEDHIILATNGNTERARITSAGLVGIGTSSPDQLLHVYQSSGSSQAYLHVQNNRSRNAAIKFTTTQGSWLVGQGIGNDNDRFAIYDTAERFVINSSANCGIGTASPTHRLHVSGTSRTTTLLVNASGGHNSSRVNIVGHTTGSHTNIRCSNSAGTQLFLVRNDNACFVGNLSKNSGSFFIPHPLPSLAATKTLRHSFIEGPQCDNIYRGKVTLSSGTASINLDTVSKMTEGTFVVLNRDVQCFTSNETGWNAVKGSVTGNILTITCENNSSTDTISWMVVGERQDPGIKESTITDDDGYLLVEEDKEDEVV